MSKYRNFRDFTDQVGNDPKLQADLKSDPTKVLNNVRIDDKWVYRMAIWILGLVITLIICGAIYFISIDKVIPEFFITLASTALGAIAGLISQNT